MPRLARLLLLLVLATTALPAAAQRYPGTLATGDARLTTGEFYDTFSFEVTAGQRVALRLTSAAFDPYLIVRPPASDALENDDCTPGDTATACLDFVAARSGTYRVLATSYAPGEAGAYVLEVTIGGDAPPDADALAVSGQIGAGSPTLATGEYVAAHEAEVRAGQRVRATLHADGFDGYLIAQAPSRSQHENDDCTPGDTATSCLDFVAAESGTWRFLATSYAPGEAGRYALRVALGDDAERVAAGGGVRYERGRLAPGDATLDSGEYRDEYAFTGTGGPVVVDLRSADFDPYLIVALPDGQQIENDDFEGALDRALVVVQTERGVRYRALVTSYAPGETGDYDLVIREGSPEAPLAAGVRTERGRLGEGDERLRTGEFVRVHAFEGVPGQRVRIDLTSDDFDTYLLVQPPRGAVVEDDDGGGRAGHSVVEMDLTEPGTYQVLVTSYAPGETGGYALRMDFSERFGQPPATPAGSAAAPTAAMPSAPAFWQPVARRIADWTLAEDITGMLTAADARLPSGEHFHTHVFDGEAGEPIRIHLRSEAFDTFLVVAMPSGERLVNDDHEGSMDDSVLEFVMPETGRYRITVTSYRAGETGPYTLRLSQADAMRPEPPQFDRIVGLFVGVSDYNGRSTDLRYTADDARLVHDALRQAGMAAGDGIVLTDAQATTGAFREALRTLAARADERTMFVLFFSGHGGQYPRATFQREDPDMLDESIELYDGYILDDELDTLLAGLPARYQLIAIDACFSGGFAKDVISRPGRMGLFSSEEDVVSQVALKFEAGGYLSRFFADAIGGGLADEDGNGAITALELSQYIYERFRGDVVNSGREAIVARETRPAHQKLVVDRGSVGLYETLFVLPD